MEKQVQPFVETIIGEQKTVMKQFALECSNCGQRSTKIIPVDVIGEDLVEYQKLLLKRQRDHIEALSSLNKQLILKVNQKNERATKREKNPSIIGIIKHALMQRGMSEGEALNMINLL